MRRFALLATLLLAASAHAQPITLVPAGGPPGGSADAVLALDGGVVLLVQDGRLFRSTDAGTTWTRPATPHERGPVHLRRGSDGAVYLSDGYGSAALRSTDTGATWTNVAGTDLRAAFAFRTARHGWFAAASDTSVVLRSLDEGRTWQRVRAGIRDGSFGRAFLGSLATNASGDLFAHVQTAEYLYSRVSQVYQWQPDSLRWTRRLWAPGAPVGFGFDADGRGLALSVADRESYGSDDAHVSNDGGRTWQSAGLPCTSPGWLMCIPLTLRASPEGRLWAGTAGGAFTREGDVWRNVGLGSVPVRALAFAVDGTAYAASGTADDVYGPHGRGLFRRLPGRTDWMLSGPSEATTFVTALSDDARAAATLGGVWQAGTSGWTPMTADTAWINGGPGAAVVVGAVRAPWGRTLVRVGFPSVPTGTALAPDAADAAVTGAAATGAGIVALGDGIVVSLGRQGWGVVRSTDRGRTFTAADSLTGAVALARRADGRLFAAGTSVPGRGASRLWTSADSGATWTRLPTPAVAPSLSNLAVRDGTSTIYLVSNLTSSSSRFFRSDDGGQTWRETGTGGSGRLLVHSPSGDLYLATRGDLSRSLTDGATWETLVEARGGGAAARWTPGWTWPFAFDAAGHLVTAAPDGGLLRSAWPVDADAVEAPAAASALRVWPNPAPSAVRIDAGTPERVAGAVYDVLGRVVARLDGPGDALAWDASASAPGVYVVRVVTLDGRVETARVVVAR